MNGCKLLDDSIPFALLLSLLLLFCILPEDLNLFMRISVILSEAGVHLEDLRNQER